MMRSASAMTAEGEIGFDMIGDSALALTQPEQEKPMSEHDPRDAEIAELKDRISGLEDLVASLGEFLRKYADYAASTAEGKIEPPMVRGSSRFTERQSQILDIVTRRR
ncbi:hypothetical protein [Paracoccus yeei]|uniref:hypothetical protein n=1 Tax=Paracoccus yeei TaxID=147645 RepID=UPI003BF826CF